MYTFYLLHRKHVGYADILNLGDTKRSKRVKMFPDGREEESICQQNEEFQWINLENRFPFVLSFVSLFVTF